MEHEVHKANTQYEILTPDGWMPFAGIQKVVKHHCTEIITDNCKLFASEKHRVMDSTGEWIACGHLRVGDSIKTANGKQIVRELTAVHSEQVLYDCLEIPNRSYFTNGVVSHNCEFLGSMHTLVHPEKLKCMAYRTPEYSNTEGLRVYARPLPDHKYVIVVDTSRGVGQDYHAFSVVDVTGIPYRVAATFRNNELAPMLYPNAIYPVARQYNNAFVLVEINDIGQQVADILHDDLEYDNIIYVQMQGRKGQVVNGGFGKGGSAMKGVKTSTAVKRIGCAILKNLIEDTKLIVEDFNVVDELCTFVARGDSFEAEENHNDDLVMTLVLFSWLTTQAYFKDITGSDIRRDLYEDQMKNLEEEMTPFGFVDDGQDSQMYTDNSGTAWNWGEEPM
jgi:hypothetical protein